MSMYASAQDAQMAAQLKNTRDKVKYILRAYPNCRDDDTELQWRYCVMFGDMKYLPLDEFKKLMQINFETIRRSRQLLQEAAYSIQDMGNNLMGNVPISEILPTKPEVIARRRGKAKAMRQVIYNIKEEEKESY